MDELIQIFKELGQFIGKKFDDSFSISEKNTNDIRQDIRGIKTPDVQKVEIVNQIEIPPYPEMPQIPEVVFPETQKVEVTNFPEQKAPIVNVPAPIVNVPETVVNVEAPIVNVPETVVNVEKVQFPKIQKVEVTNPQTTVTLVDKNGKEVTFEVPSTFKLDETQLRIISASRGGGGTFSSPEVETKLDNIKLAVDASGGVTWDLITLTEATLTDTYVYSYDGSTVQTITITYTLADKKTISNVTKV